MTRESASLNELINLWNDVDGLWKSQENKIEYPWVESKFKLAISRALLAQRNLRIPSEFGSF